MNKSTINLSLFTAFLITSLMHPSAPPALPNPTFAKLTATAKPENDPFARLALEAARRYNQSSDEKKKEPTPEAPVFATPEPQPQINAQENQIDLSKASNLPHSNPILAKHKEFFDNWWNALFVPCSGCTDRNEKIDCKKLLADNPQWEEVKLMNQQAKNFITQRALKRFVDISDACNLACSLCAGGSPDTKLDDEESHTALHLSTGEDGLKTKQHYGIFNLLLQQGVSPNKPCINYIPVHPLAFDMPLSWKDELQTYGAKLSNNDDNDD